MSPGLPVKPLIFFSSLIPAENEAGVFMGRDVCGVCVSCPDFCTRYWPSGVQDQTPGVIVLLQVSRNRWLE